MVQVIGIGYGRTGTASLQQALNLLGYKTFHTKTMMLERRELLDTWYRNATTASDDFCPFNLTELLEGYTAATGMLFAVCLEKAMQEFPQAHFILTQRESSEEWYKSWSTLMSSVALLPQYAPWLPRVKQIDYYNRWLLSWIHGKEEGYFTQKHPLVQDSVRAQQSYEQHLETARRLIPAHRLLVLQVGSDSKSGWGPLCGFRNVSLPVLVSPSAMYPYPHSGTSQQVIWQCRLVVILANLVLLLALYVLTRLIARITQPSKKKSAARKERVEEKDDGPVQDCDNDDCDEDDYIPNVKILPESNTDPSSSHYLLTMPQMQQLAAKALPPIVALRCWKRIYRLSRDGDDFGTFLNTTKGHAQTLLILQTTGNNNNKNNPLFGAFADSLWDASNRENYNINSVGGSGFYGSTQACLFAFSDKDKKEGEGSETTLKVFKWSGINRYIQLFDASRGRIAFGCSGDGKGGFGLCIEDNFSKGTTAACETFNNDRPLTGDAEQFAILDVEIWTFPRGTLG